MHGYASLLIQNRSHQVWPCTWQCTTMQQQGLGTLRLRYARANPCARLCTNFFMLYEMFRSRYAHTHLCAQLCMPLHLHLMEILSFSLQVLASIPLSLIQNWAYLINQQKNTKIKLKLIKINKNL